MKKRGKLDIMKRMVAFLLIFCMVEGMMVYLKPVSAVCAATDGIKIEYNSKTVNYTGIQVAYQIHSKSIDMDGTPGIILDNIALASYTDIFKSGLGASCSYNSKTKKITIKKYDKIAELTLNSKKAKINGNSVTLTVAPREVLYKDKKKSKILVPTRTVAEALGYCYEWDSKTGMVTLDYDGWEEYYIDKKWTKYTKTKGKVVCNGKNIDVAAMPAIIQDNVVLIQAKKVFSGALGAEYGYKKEGTQKKLTLKKDDITLKFTMGSKIAKVNGVDKKMSTEARVIKNKRNGKSYVMIPAKFAVTNLGYSYTWDKQNKKVVIKTRSAKTYFAWSSKNVIEEPQNPYNNFIKSVVSDTDGNDDKVNIEGVAKISAEISTSRNKDIIYINIANAFTDIPETTEKIADSGSKLKSVSMTATKGGGLKFALKVTAGTEYYVSAIGENYTIHFADSDVASGYEMSFDKPEKVNVNDITNKDKYWNKKFVITIPGNYVDYYQEHPVMKNSTVIKSVSVALNSSGNTTITVVTRKLQGYRIDFSNDQVFVKIDSPQKIYQNIVVLDPGHGGTDPGAISDGVNEKDIVYSILYTYGKKYFNAKDSRVKAYWTRVNDKKIELNDRAAFASSIGADCFISLHMNSATPTAKGTEVYYSYSNNTKTASGLTSEKLADCLKEKLVTGLSMKDRGVKTAQFVVVKNNTVPAILVELGFISNAEDRKKFTDSKYQKKTAKLFYQAVVDIFSQYPTGR